MSAEHDAPEGKSESDSASVPNLDRDLKRMALILGWMLIVAGSLWALFQVWPVVRWGIATLSPFLIALVVAYIFNPVVNIVQRKFKLGRIGGIIAVGLLIVVLFVAFFGLLLPILYVQATNLTSAITTGGEKLEPLVASKLDSWKLDEVLKKFGIDDTQALWNKAREYLDQLDLQATLERATSLAPSVTQGGAKALGSAANAALQIFTGITGFFATMVLVVVIAFYYLLEFGGIPRLVKLVLPPRIEDRSMDILGKVDVAVGGFLRGQLIVCSLVGLVATVGLSMIGMYKYALIVGVVAGAANFIPYLGPVVGATPAVLWALLSSGHETWPERFVYVGLVIGLFALIQIVDGFVFQPRIVGKSANLHPLAVMAALVIGGQFGLSGMIIAVPMACIARVLLKELWWDNYVAMQRRDKT